MHDQPEKRLAEASSGDLSLSQRRASLIACSSLSSLERKVSETGGEHYSHPTSPSRLSISSSAGLLSSLGTHRESSTSTVFSIDTYQRDSLLQLPAITPLSALGRMAEGEEESGGSPLRRYSVDPTPRPTPVAGALLSRHSCAVDY